MKIGIIGSGGAGMCAAWLLDQEQDHEILMLERADYEGGETHSVDVDIKGIKYEVDDGAAWFSPTIYPYFNRYLELTAVEYDWIPATLTYYNKERGQVTLVPPVTFRSIFLMFTQWHVIPQLLALLKVIIAAGPLIKERNTQVTYGEFMRGVNVSDKMKEDFLKPLIAGVWGGPLGLTDGFSMYPLLKYIYYQQPHGLKFSKWKVMHGGTGQYIKTVADQLMHTKIELKDGVTSISPDGQSGNVRVKTKRGEVYEFDKLIITSGAWDVAALIADSPALKPLSDVVQQFKAYKALLATHGDTSFMPPLRKDWSIANVKYDVAHSHATVWHGGPSGIDLFSSYIDEDVSPKNLYYLSKWWLPLETPAFFRAQKKLEPLQGQHNIWLAGAYTLDIGSHESAIVSAMKAVEGISPGSVRLKKLKEGIKLQW